MVSSATCAKKKSTKYDYEISHFPGRILAEVQCTSAESINETFLAMMVLQECECHIVCSPSNDPFIRAP